MQLSVIIVNYNVKYFLEQCLCSVQKAVQGLQAEILVVDNASTDGSKEYLAEKFPAVQFIWSNENLGFAKANNLALKKAKGEFILFLNPDTIVAEDSFTNCISFFEAHADAGALGVRMIDGSGNFLPESKRGFPSSSASFYKLSGLSVLFPQSKTFARYHLGYLSEHETYEVDVLSGAFMMVRKEVLEQTGGFDESFFMYAEDIDLSYRITKAKNKNGFYKNYFFSGTTIIHFKGESTQKGSAAYTKLFYKAMLQFVTKHKEEFSNGLMNVLIKMAVLLSGALSRVKQIFLADKKAIAPSAFFVLGNEADAMQVQILTVKGVGDESLFEQKRASADAAVLCEGEHLSFKQVIALTQKHGSKLLVCVHARASKSMVGSNSKNKTGFAVELW
jgi:GT2 family glycosyltransferase